MNPRMMEIERLCNMFLLNFEHPSRKERVERIIEELHKATAPVPKDLGIHVGEKLGAKGTMR